MNTTRVLQLVVTLMAALCSQSAIARDQPATPERPNLILIVADDHGLDAIGCYGNSIIQTPNMDRLAAAGVRFTRAYCTSASCPDGPHRGHPFKPDPWDTPNTFGNRPEGYPGVKPVRYDPQEVNVPAFLPDSRECREEIAEYYQSISRIDQGLGRLLELLENSGKSDNTVVIYLSDNGVAFPGAKTTAYEPGIQLPLIVTDPRKRQAGLVNQAMVTWADLTPTLLEIANVKFTPSDFHGRSFWPVLTEPKPAGWNTMYASHNFHELTMYYPMRVVREENFKLIWNIAWRLEYPFASDLWASSTWQGIHRAGAEYFGNRQVKRYLFRPEFELYDLATDAHELANLADKVEFSATLDRLQGKMKRFQLKTKDPWQIMWNNESQVQGTGVGL